MPGLAVALAFLAQAAARADTPTQAYGPAVPVVPKAASAEPAKTAERECVTEPKGQDSREIEVCAPKPQGYRIDPDVLAARRMKKQMMAGRPHNPHESFKDDKCKVVGPAPCMDAPMINLLAAAATAAEMAERLSKGQEIGSMFVTDPQPSEYQLYQEAKKEREAKEAATAAKAKAKVSGAAIQPAPTPEPPKAASQ
jgi:hypothetical protein